MDAEIHCDAPITLANNGLLKKNLHGTDLRFRIYNMAENGLRHRIYPGPKMRECLLSFKNPETGEHGAIRIRNMGLQFPFLQSLAGYREYCELPKSSVGGVKELFLTPAYTSMTCPQKVDSIQTLESPEQGFNAKVAALLGRPVSADFIKNADPFAPLDFSHAPKLNAIFVASLVYRSDFYGNVLGRLLKYHADRGTLVYILVSEILQSEKDRRLLNGLARSNGNIKVQEYHYNSETKNPLSPDKLNQLHRDMHIKILATYSETDPSKNIVISGGRNIHDGFLFREKPDLSKYPELTQWGQDENFVHWSDFEMQIQSPTFAKKIFSHLLTVWHMDSKTQAWDSLNKNFLSATDMDWNYFKNPEQILVRHFVSVPFKDQNSLERLYVEMIDKAASKIKLSSPYLRPTDKISAALDRAIRRGVDVTIQTRIDLSGDTLDWLYTEMNKESINHFKDRVKLYEWTRPSILHSKFLLIDGEFGFIGSVNVSRRSFVHDIESGFLIHGKNFIQQMEGIFDGYTAVSRRVTEKQKRKIVPSALIKIFENEF